MKVAIYIRVSSEEQVKEGFSIPAQRQKLMGYAELQEWDIFDIYIDEGISGAKMDRPELNRLREDMKNGTFNMVLVWRVDRFFRNLYFLSTLLHEMERYKVSFKSMTESFDTSSSSGKAMLQMLGIFAEWERDTIRDRIMNALSERARLGYHHAKPPFGYDRQDKLIVPNEKAEIIKDIFDYRIKDTSKMKITELLIAKYGYEQLELEKKGQVYWFVDRVLKNSVYAGKVKKGEEEFDGIHEPLISEETFNSIQNMKSNRYERHFHIFRGMVYCGQCGSRYTARRKKIHKTNDYKSTYYCPNSRANPSTLKDSYPCKGRLIDESSILKLVVKKLKTSTVTLDTNLVDEEYKKEENKDKQKQINDQIKSLRNKKRRYFEMFEKDSEFEDMARERIKELTRSIELLEEEKEKLAQPISKSTIDKEIVVQAIEHLDQLIESADKEEMRNLFMSLFDKIIVIRLPDDTPGRIKNDCEIVWAE